MSTAVSTTDQRKNHLATVGAALEKMKPQLQAVLPKHITPDRLARVALVAIQNQPKLLECDRNSLYLAILRSAQLGLEPDGILGQAYLVPFYNSKEKRTDVQFIPGYRGLIDLARRSGEVSNIIAREVCENDKFEVDYSLDIPFVHKPLLKGDRGEVTHFWALARFKDGGFHWDYMTAQEVVDIRDQSAGWQAAVKFKSEANSPWKKHFVEMGKKTVIRRIAKYLPMSVQRAAAFETLQDAGHKIDFDGGDLVITEPSENLIEDKSNGSAKLDQFGADNPDETYKLPSMETADEAKRAGEGLAAVLKALDATDRPTAFVKSRGPEIIDALHKFDHGAIVQKIEALGIGAPIAKE